MDAADLPREEQIKAIEPAAAAAKRLLTLQLEKPIQFGKELITELVLRPSAKAFRDFSLPMKADGTILFQPYELASVGVRMARYPSAVVDMLAPEDMIQLAHQVMDFFAPAGPKTGSEPSP